MCINLSRIVNHPWLHFLILVGLGLACQGQRPKLPYQKINPCQNIYRKKRVKVRSTPATTLKERTVKIIKYLGLDIIIKLKFTTIFERCAILNVLNYLTKNFES